MRWRRAESGDILLRRHDRGDGDEKNTHGKEDKSSSKAKKHRSPTANRQNETYDDPKYFLTPCRQTLVRYDRRDMSLKFVTAYHISAHGDIGCAFNLDSTFLGRGRERFEACAAMPAECTVIWYSLSAR